MKGDAYERRDKDDDAGRRLRDGASMKGDAYGVAIQVDVLRLVVRVVAFMKCEAHERPDTALTDSTQVATIAP